MVALGLPLLLLCLFGGSVFQFLQLGLPGRQYRGAIGFGVHGLDGVRHIGRLDDHCIRGQSLETCAGVHHGCKVPR